MKAVAYFQSDSEQTIDTLENDTSERVVIRMAQEAAHHSGYIKTSFKGSYGFNIGIHVDVAFVEDEEVDNAWIKLCENRREPYGMFFYFDKKDICG